MKRHPDNPLITPDILAPSAPGLKVLGAFNAGVTVYNNQIILLLRVAERCIEKPEFVSVPIYSFANDKSEFKIINFRKNDPDVFLKDTRGVVYKGIDYLSTLSTIRIARSNDGINFIVDNKPFIFPEVPEEKYGCEDARVQKFSNEFFITYSAVSQDGWATSLATTRDFKSLNRKGMIFYPLDKDVCLFPEKINGRYYALHRPHNEGFGKPSVWISSSDNLLDWGGHKCLIRPRENKWESQKIGAGGPPIKTDKGWLVIYHGKGDNSVYHLFTLLLDKSDPTKILSRADVPFFSPEKSYETNGFFPNVVFSNGHIEQPNGEIFIYYGACDETTNLLITTVDELLADVMK
ncbi:MAG: glycosidase [Chlamydiae bacterium]|nr:MAG: glycosidase [Chlamydiota bacterium]